MKKILRIFIISLLIILIVSLAASVYSFITEGSPNLNKIYNANFLAGACIIGAALALIFPLSRLLKRDNLNDHSTFAERHIDQQEKKQKKGYTLLFTGILLIIITSLVQLVLSKY